MKKIKCITCKQDVPEKQIDKERDNWKQNPLCKSCSDEVFNAFNQE